MFLSFNTICRFFLFLAVFYSCLYIDLFVAFLSMKSLFLCVLSYLWFYIICILIVLIFTFALDYKDSMFLYICLNMFVCFYLISSSLSFGFLYLLFVCFLLFVSFVISLWFFMFFFCLPIPHLVFLFIYLTYYLNT